MILGHVAQVGTLLEAAAGGRMHHAWLLAGPSGIGKATVAQAFAARLLAGVDVGLDLPAEHPTSRLLAAGSHPDFRRLERLAKDGKGEELARSISVAQVRALGPMFATAPSLSPRRVILIDAIDDLERAAANALLKMLEEPPAGTTFLLVSHAPGRLLPTIRSRCRLLRFARLDVDDTAAVLARQLDDPAEANALARIADGAPGAALRFAGLDVAAMDDAIDRIVRGGDPHNAERGRLARSLALKAAQPRYELFLERAPGRLAMEARERTGGPLAAAILAWERAREIADGAVRLSLDPAATVFEIAGLLASLAPPTARAKA